MDEEFLEDVRQALRERLESLVKYEFETRLLPRLVEEITAAVSTKREGRRVMVSINLQFRKCE